MRPASTRAIAKAAQQPHARVGLARVGRRRARIEVDATIADVPADVEGAAARSWMAVTEDGISTSWSSAARTAAARCITTRSSTSCSAASWPRRSVLGFHATLRPEWRRDHLKAVVVLQGKKTHRIYGAAATPLK